MIDSVKVMDLMAINPSEYRAAYVGCLVLTKDHQILLQHRGHDFVTFSNYLCEFGGRVENEEQPIEALIRELHEELGAEVQENEVISLGVLTEAISDHAELIYAYFWHDVNGTITGCYEGSSMLFDHVAPILAYSKITDGLRWMLNECQRKKLITK